MLPRRIIREEFLRHFENMTVPVTKSQGQIYRLHEQDLPAINVTTLSDALLDEDRVHGDTIDLFYQQDVVVELHIPMKNNFEDELDRLEEEFWTVVATNFYVAGVDIQYQGSEVTPVQNVDNPHAIKLLTFTARYAVDGKQPTNIVI